MTRLCRRLLLALALIIVALISYSINVTGDSNEDNTCQGNEVNTERIVTEKEITTEGSNETLVAGSDLVKSHFKDFVLISIPVHSRNDSSNEATTSMDTEEETTIQETETIEYSTETTEYVIIETKITEREKEISAEEAFNNGSVWYYTPEYYPTNLTSLTPNTEYNRNLLIHLLACEGGGSWDGYVWTCSCILNLCDYYNMDLESIAYDFNLFTLTHTNSREDQRDYIWNFNYNIPTATEVVEYVLNGHRVSNIKWFRTGGFHHWDNGGPISVAHVGGHYYSK